MVSLTRGRGYCSCVQKNGNLSALDFRSEVWYNSVIEFHHLNYSYESG